MHACHFYRGRDELIATLVPYFAAGLRANERCLWVTAPPLPAPDATDALRMAWPAVDDAIAAGALGILDLDRWHTKDQVLRGIDAVAQWLDEEERALAGGYSGLRIGNSSFVEPGDWAAVMAYEQAVTARFKGRRIVSLCSYPIERHDEHHMAEVKHADPYSFERSGALRRVIVGGRAALAAREAQADQRAEFFDHMGVGMAQIDAAGRFTLVNDRLGQLLGLAGKELLGRPIVDFMHPEDRARALATAAEVMESGLPRTIDARHLRPEGSAIWLHNSLSMACSADKPRLLLVAQDITDRKEVEARQQLVNHELVHRSRNVLAVVQAIVTQTLRYGRDASDAVEIIEGRLVALSRAHEALMSTEWTVAPIADVVRGGIAVSGSDHPRIRADGPGLDVGPRTAMALAMVLHELCINAIKYGALSNDSGTVILEWTVTNAADRRFKLRWKEQGGPSVVAPVRKGFGSRIVGEYCRSELRAESTLSFRSDGLEWNLDAPLSSLQK